MTPFCIHKHIHTRLLIHPSKQTSKQTNKITTLIPQTHQRQVELHKRQRLAPYDVALKGFKYHEALDAALAQRNPRTIVAVLEELIMRRVRVKRDRDGLVGPCRRWV